jgi:hypothetical protein
VKNNAADGVRLKVYERQEPERVRKGWKLAEALLAAARDETARAGGRLVLLAVPDRLQVEDALWQQAMEEFHLDPAQYDRDQPDRRLREIAGRLGITLADPLDAQRAKAAGGANLFVPDDPHWNAEGHAIAAEVLRAALRPLVETSPDPMAGAR